MHLARQFISNFYMSTELYDIIINYFDILRDEAALPKKRVASICFGMPIFFQVLFGICYFVSALNDNL